MSLVKCPACENAMSENCEKCPHCGEPNRKAKKCRCAAAGIVALILAAVVTGVFVAVYPWHVEWAKLTWIITDIVCGVIAAICLTK